MLPCTEAGSTSPFAPARALRRFDPSDNLGQATLVNSVTGPNPWIVLSCSYLGDRYPGTGPSAVAVRMAAGDKYVWVNRTKRVKELVAFGSCNAYGGTFW